MWTFVSIANGSFLLDVVTLMVAGVISSGAQRGGAPPVEIFVCFGELSPPEFTVLFNVH